MGIQEFELNNDHYNNRGFRLSEQDKIINIGDQDINEIIKQKYPNIIRKDTTTNIIFETDNSFYYDGTYFDTSTNQWYLLILIDL